MSLRGTKQSPNVEHNRSIGRSPRHEYMTRDDGGVEFRPHQKKRHCERSAAVPKMLSTIVPIRRSPRHGYMTRVDGGC